MAISMPEHVQYVQMDSDCTLDEKYFSALMEIETGRFDFLLCSLQSPPSQLEPDQLILNQTPSPCIPFTPDNWSRVEKNEAYENLHAQAVVQPSPATPAAVAWDGPQPVSQDHPCAMPSFTPYMPLLPVAPLQQAALKQELRDHQHFSAKTADVIELKASNLKGQETGFKETPKVMASMLRGSHRSSGMALELFRKLVGPEQVPEDLHRQYVESEAAADASPNAQQQAGMAKLDQDNAANVSWACSGAGGGMLRNKRPSIAISGICNLFLLPYESARKQSGLSKTSFKQLMKQEGFAHWPQRQLLGLKSLFCSTKSDLHLTPIVRQARMKRIYANYMQIVRGTKTCVDPDLKAISHVYHNRSHQMRKPLCRTKASHRAKARPAPSSDAGAAAAATGFKFEPQPETLISAQDSPLDSSGTGSDSGPTLFPWAPCSSAASSFRSADVHVNEGSPLVQMMIGSPIGLSGSSPQLSSDSPSRPVGAAGAADVGLGRLNSLTSGSEDYAEQLLSSFHNGSFPMHY